MTDERDLPFVPYADLSEKRGQQLQEMRPDLQSFQLRGLEVRFEFDRNRVATRHPLAVRRRIDRMLADIRGLAPTTRLATEGFSSCPTYMTILSQ